ncbi:histidine kinase N-terminal 7TM domain-containing protein [Haloarcula sp. CGMCC 1.6347]|uniref:histidine kinase N-terminal 7TM domain-containing protein n=1 Tax=Haloarcula sp. CGMCC 1.6347 TaxID=3111455 RepID=UPI00300F2E48
MFQFTPIALPLLLTTVMTALTAVLIWTRVLNTSSGRRPANQAQFLTLVCITVWSAGQVVAVVTTTHDLILFGNKITFIATLWTAVAWFFFALYYTGRDEWITRHRVGLLLVTPLLGTLGYLTNDATGLFLIEPTVTDIGSRTVLEFGWGIGTWLGAVHNWTLAVIGSWFLLGKFRSSRNIYRKITLMNLMGAFVLNAGPFLSLTGLSPFRYFVLSVVGFLIVAALSALTVGSYRRLQYIPVERILSLFSHRWNDLTPMARNAVIQTMQSGVVVVDRKNRIVDVNPMGKRILGAQNKRIVGEQLTDVVSPSVFASSDTSFFDPSMTAGEFNDVWVETPEGENRCFDAQITSLGSDDDPIGRTALIKDVTDRELRKKQLEHRTRELERQNEQLQQFAGIVSHDLRNPLTVASGHIQIAKETGDESALDEAEHALNRMEAIIEDMLTLAKQGRSIGETETVTLSSIAQQAWENVDTQAISLDITGEYEFEADSDRLLNLFENLYRNARDHAGPNVTLTVGEIDDGFFVADDGVGIPEDKRESVLNHGITTSDSGTGFGLSIVEQIVDAHGWDVSVTESADGGAKFEFTGVEQPDFGYRYP